MNPVSRPGRLRTASALCRLFVGALASVAFLTGADSARPSEPAKVEVVPGAEVKRVVLAEQAAQRLGIETAPVTQAPMSSKRGSGDVAPRAIVPYAGVLYDVQGQAWAYTSPEPLVFVRHRLIIEYIDGDRAVLSAGPPLGTAVVTVGAAELYGIEFGIGK